MILLTTGSMLPFDRLVRLVDQAVADGFFNEPVFGQIGESRYEPQHFSYERFLDSNEFNRRFQEASLVIGHAGIGVIITAMNYKVPLLILPRRQKYKEHVNDHQVSTALKFEELGHVMTFEADTLNEKLEMVKTFIPKPRQPNVQGVGNRIIRFLEKSI